MLNEKKFNKTTQTKTNQIKIKLKNLTKPLELKATMNIFICNGF